MLGVFLASGPGTVNAGLSGLRDCSCVPFENLKINSLTAFTSRALTMMCKLVAKNMQSQISACNSEFDCYEC